jgi:lyso-ornithine lipid O-acyltransferase
MYFRSFFRAIFFAFYTFKVVLTIYIRGKFSKNYTIKDAMPTRKVWANTLLNRVGVRLETKGIAPNFPCLVVSNHRSYLDPILMLTEIDGCPVSKAEVEDWPILGYGAKLSGILYLQREDAGSRSATLKAILKTIKDGFPVILFPEGTTSNLETTLPFKKGAFQIAAKFKIPIVPVAVIYEDKNDHWVGNQPFLSNAFQTFKKKNINVQIHYGTPILNNDPDELLLLAKNRIIRFYPSNLPHLYFTDA